MLLTHLLSVRLRIIEPKWDARNDIVDEMWSQTSRYAYHNTHTHTNEQTRIENCRECNYVRFHF